MCVFPFGGYPEKTTAILADTPCPLSCDCDACAAEGQLLFCVCVHVCVREREGERERGRETECVWEKECVGVLWLIRRVRYRATAMRALLKVRSLSCLLPSLKLSWA